MVGVVIFLKELSWTTFQRAGCYWSKSNADARLLNRWKERERERGDRYEKLERAASILMIFNTFWNSIYNRYISSESRSFFPRTSIQQRCKYARLSDIKCIYQPVNRICAEEHKTHLHSKMILKGRISMSWCRWKKKYSHEKKMRGEKKVRLCEEWMHRKRNGNFT